MKYPNSPEWHGQVAGHDVQAWLQIDGMVNFSIDGKPGFGCAVGVTDSIIAYLIGEGVLEPILEFKRKNTAVIPKLLKSPEWRGQIAGHDVRAWLETDGMFDFSIDGQPGFGNDMALSDTVLAYLTREGISEAILAFKT